MQVSSVSSCHTLALTIPAIATLEDDVVKALPASFQLAMKEASAGVFCTNTQERVPAAIRAELDEWHACSPTISDQGTGGIRQMHPYLIQQASYDLPLALNPTRFGWHDRPCHWQDP